MVSGAGGRVTVRATFIVPGKEKDTLGNPNRNPCTREEVDACRRFYEAWRASQ